MAILTESEGYDSLMIFGCCVGNGSGSGCDLESDRCPSFGRLYKKCLGRRLRFFPGNIQYEPVIISRYNEL
jgi:hypothetical protein